MQMISKIQAVLFDKDGNRCERGLFGSLEAATAWARTIDGAVKMKYRGVVYDLKD